MTERSYTASELRYKASVLAGASNRAFLAGSFYMADIWRSMALECLYWSNMCDNGEKK